MADKVLITKSKLDTLAESVSAKSGQEVPLTIDEMNEAVLSIAPKLQAKSVGPSIFTQKVEPDSGYDGLSRVDVGAMKLTSVTVTPQEYQQTINASEGGYDGFSGFTVNQIPGEYIVPEGTRTITSNGTGIDVYGYEFVDVAVPSSGGGYVTQDAQGYIVLPETGDGTPTPSSSGSMSDPIRFFDYDGTLVASYSSVPASLPSVPSHTGLTNGAWNYTLQEVTTQINAMGACDVGANYETVSGATEIDIEFVDSARLSPYLRFAVNGTVTVDWGDNSETEDVTGTSATTYKSIQHVYAQPGSYTIKLFPTVETIYAIYGTTTTFILHANINSTPSLNDHYAACVKHVRIGVNCNIGSYAFCRCRALETVSIPSTYTSSIGQYAFRYCDVLNFCSVPKTTTSLNSYSFSDCSGIKSVSLPLKFSVLPNYHFNNCYLMSRAPLTANITTIGQYTFYSAYSLASIVIPSGVTSIQASAFSNCHGVKEYHLKPMTPPTLGTGAFANRSSDCIIYVPQSKLNDYKTAENWATYADYIVGE